MHRNDDKLAALTALVGHGGHVDDLEREWLLSEVGGQFPIPDPFANATLAWELNGDDPVATWGVDATGHGHNVVFVAKTPIKTAGVIGDGRRITASASYFNGSLDFTARAQPGLTLIWWEKYDIIIPKATTHILVTADYKQGFYLGWTSGAQTRWFLAHGTGTGTINNNTYASISAVGQWRMYDLRYRHDAKTVEFRENCVTKIVWPVPTIVWGNSMLAMGDVYGGTAQTLNFDMLRLFSNVVLTDEQLAQHYNAGAGLAFGSALPMRESVHTNALWLAYFKANGATSNNWNTAAQQFLAGAGFTGNLADAWAGYWASL